MPYDSLITAYTLVVAALLGLVVGSFVNCWAWRYVRGESVVRGRSHCASCGHGLAARDLVPIISWIILRGRCRHCGARVSARYPLTEAVCAAVFVAITAVYGVTVETAELLLFASVLLMLSLVDFEERIIPNGCILAALAVRAAYLAYACASGLIDLSAVGFYVASGLGVGFVMLVVTLVADRAFGRPSMGGGDLKLFAVAGFYFGWQQSLFLVIASCLIGIAATAVAIALPGGSGGQDPAAARAKDAGDAQGAGLAEPTEHANPASPAALPEEATSTAAEPAEDEGFLRRTIPFGPSIAVACVLTMLVGNPLISWYLGLL